MSDTRFIQIDKLWHEESLDEPLPSWLERQHPIPWCTTHDLPLEAFRNEIHVCYDVQEYPPDCVASLGPPDHKWWKDV